MAQFPVRVGIFTNPLGSKREYPNDLRTWAVRGSPALLASTQKPSDLGRNYTDRPQPPLWYRDWSMRGSISLLASTQKPSDLGQNYTDRPQLRLPVGNTWIETPQLVVSAGLPPGESYTDRPSRVLPPAPSWAQFNPNLTQDELPVGESYTDRPRGLPLPVPTWTQFNPNLSQDELPVGESYTDRPQTRIPVNYTWIETPSQPSVTVTLPPGGNFTDKPPPLPRIGQTWIETPQLGLTPVGPLPSYDWQIPPSMVDRAVDLRTWIATPPQPSVTVTLPPGESFTERPRPVAWYREWLLSLQQTTLIPTVTLPTGEGYTDRPRPVAWSNTWTSNLQETTLAPTAVLPTGKVYTDRPAPIYWYREWLLNLQQTTLAPAVISPVGETFTDRPATGLWYRDWSQNLLGNTLSIVYMPASIVECSNPITYPRIDQTWIQTPQTVLTPTVTLPPGGNFTERPRPVSWYRDWSINLQATTLAPAVFPVGETFTDLPQRGPAPLVPSWGWFNINLSQDELPVGEIYTARPQPPPWYREWLLNLQQSTLAPPPAVFPPGQVYADRPAPISWFRDWTVNLGEFTPVGPDVLPPGGALTSLPPAPAPQFNRSWESPYNVNLFSPTSFGPIPVRVGAVGRRKRERERPVDPWSKTFSRQHWKELQALIQVEADAAVEAERRNDPELAVAADAAREVAETLYLADETPAINRNIVRLTASLRAGAAKRAEMEAEALTAYLAELEDESECELLLFS